MKTRLARTSVEHLLRGYEREAPLLDIERLSMTALCMILNTESALCGLHYDIPALVDGARTVGSSSKSAAWGAAGRMQFGEYVCALITQARRTRMTGLRGELAATCALTAVTLIGCGAHGADVLLRRSTRPVRRLSACMITI